MNYCKNCRWVLPENENKCTICGMPVADENTEIIVKPNAETQSGEYSPEFLASQPPDEPPIMMNEPEIRKKTPAIELHSEEAQISMFKKIALIALSVFIAPVGMIAGLIMMAAPDKSDKDFGQIIVIISVTVFVAITMCCCAFAILGFAIASS